MKVNEVLFIYFIILFYFYTQCAHVKLGTVLLRICCFILLCLSVCHIMLLRSPMVLLNCFTLLYYLHLPFLSPLQWRAISYTPFLGFLHTFFSLMYRVILLDPSFCYFLESCFTALHHVFTFLISPPSYFCAMPDTHFTVLNCIPFLVLLHSHFSVPSHVLFLGSVKLYHTTLWALLGGPRLLLLVTCRHPTSCIWFCSNSLILSLVRSTHWYHEPWFAQE